LSYLQSKSEFNYHAAKMLIDDNIYAPSVHCSYYGLFQFINTKLNTLGFTYAKISADIRESRKNGNKALQSHEYPISLIVCEIEKQSNVIFATEVNDKITLLKLYRVQSDYLNFFIGDAQSKAALELSNEIKKLIKSKI
jgi:hypothetical protein